MFFYKKTVKRKMENTYIMNCRHAKYHMMVQCKLYKNQKTVNHENGNLKYEIGGRLQIRVCL